MSFVVVYICAALILHVHGVRITFYKSTSFTDTSYESASTSKCITLDADKATQYFITDTCLIVYYYPDCISLSRKFEPGRHTWSWKIKSFHICNEDIGGDQLNINITSFYSLHRPTETPTILESYKDVCSCVDVPEYVQKMSNWSINNNGNNLLAYFEPGCSEEKWKPISIEAGLWHESERIYKTERVDPSTGAKHKVLSFGPDPSSKYFNASCNGFPYSKIMKVELLGSFNNTKSKLRNVSELDLNVSMAQDNLLSKHDKNQISFFLYPDFQDFLFEHNITKTCSNFPRKENYRWVTYEVGSIKTDSCLILYSHFECTGGSIKLENGGTTNLTHEWEDTLTGQKTINLLYDTFPNWTWTTKSFHNCNENEGGSQLDVDITDYQVDNFKETQAMESYKNVCYCQNIPKYVRNLEKYSINNHGNSLLAYFEQDCLTTVLDPLRIPAGTSSYSLGFGMFERMENSTGSKHKIQSFAPDPNSEYFQSNCFQLNTSQSTTTTTTMPIFDTNDLQQNEATDSTPDRFRELEKLPVKVQALEAQFTQLELKIDNHEKVVEDTFLKLKDDIKEICYKINV